MAFAEPAAPVFGRALGRSALICLLALLAMSGLVAQGAGRPAASIRAESGTTADLQAAVDRAAPGDTVIIPAGTWDVTDTVRLSDGIHIRGEGRDKTVLKRSEVQRRWRSMFRIDASTGEPFTFSHLTLASVARKLLAAGDRDAIDRGIEINGKCAGFRVHHCRFTGFTHAAVFVNGRGGERKGHATGVVDNNEFIDIFYTDPGKMSLGYGVAVIGAPDEWSVRLGQPDAVFVEDNYFERCRHSVTSNGGSRYVFRYNTVQDNYYPFAAVDTHGKLLHEHGSRSCEVYKNTFSGGINFRDGKMRGTWALGIRGGDGVVFGNSFNDVWCPICLVVEGGIENRSHPVPDQVTDMWLWDNLHNGEPLARINAGVHDEQTAFFQEGRDYHFEKKPGYAPHTYPHPLRTPEPVTPAPEDAFPRNGSFDSGRRYWDIEVSDRNEGLFAVEDGALLLRRAQGDCVVAAWQDVPVEAGAHYALEYRLKVEGTGSGGVSVAFGGPDGSWIEGADVHGPQRGSTDWRDEVIRFPVPAEAGRIRISLSVTPGDVSAWFDDIRLKRAAPPETGG